MTVMEFGPVELVIVIPHKHLDKVVKFGLLAREYGFTSYFIDKNKIF